MGPLENKRDCWLYIRADGPPATRKGKADGDRPVHGGVGHVETAVASALPVKYEASQQLRSVNFGRMKKV